MFLLEGVLVRCKHFILPYKCQVLRNSCGHWLVSLCLNHLPIGVKLPLNMITCSNKQMWFISPSISTSLILFRIEEFLMDITQCWHNCKVCLYIGYSDMMTSMALCLVPPVGAFLFLLCEARVSVSPHFWQVRAPGFWCLVTWVLSIFGSLIYFKVLWFCSLMSCLPQLLGWVVVSVSSVYLRQEWNRLFPPIFLPATLTFTTSLCIPCFAFHFFP